ncbi:MAG: hypothetical protein ABIH34_02445 [Nanoarchaeota archaeon]
MDFEEVRYLENEGYKYGEFVPIGKSHKEGFYVKRNTRESLAHTFLVHNIKQHLQKHTKDLQIRITKKPDIVFKNNKGQLIALEIETGKNFKKHKQRIKNKFIQAKKNYPKIFIVLTSTKKKPYYQRLIPDIPLFVRTDIPKFIQAQFKKKRKR